MPIHTRTLPAKFLMQLELLVLRKYVSLSKGMQKEIVTTLPHKFASELVGGGSPPNQQINPDGVDEYLTRKNHDIMISLFRFLTESSGKTRSYMESVFLAGKLTDTLDVNKVLQLSLNEVNSYLQKNDITLSTNDQIIYQMTLRATYKWIESMVGELNRKVRISVLNAEQLWTTQISIRDTSGVLRKGIWDNIKQRITRGLINNIQEIFKGFSATITRFFQTDSWDKFQHGQVRTISRNEWVYKQPRRTACRECLKLHLNKNGMPKLYKIKDVQGNSNRGKKRTSWSFVLGPTHPHCYCVLRRVKQNLPQKSKILASARRDALNP